MIRFIPDTWQDALLRFFAMAAPNASVYVEIPAPDLRFAAIVMLAIAVAFCWRRLVANPRAAGALLAFVILSAVPWLATSGNGRYWMPILLMAGPLLAGLVYLLPMTRAFRLFLVAGLFAAQLFVIHQSPPWGAWNWAVWDQAPYFHVAVPKAEASVQGTTYVTLSTISYSLIAPQFPPSSRWLNITSIGGTGRDTVWAQDFLRGAPGPIKLVVPTIKDQFASDGGPAPEVRKSLDSLLGPQRLALEPGTSCTLLRSRGLGAKRSVRSSSPESRDAGFWLCPLKYPVERPAQETQSPDPGTEAVFARVEQTCPRFFAPGSKTMRINGGALRHYAGSDMKLYVLDDGLVVYKFWRALNPVTIGSREDVLSGKARVDCDHVRGRSGLPWNREI